VIEAGLRRLKPGLHLATIDLFDCVVTLLEERGLLTKAFDMQMAQGDEAVRKSLRSVLKEDRLAARIVELAGAKDLDLLIVKGVGAVYPMLRTHTLLSALHPHMRDTPLLMLYPGRQDGQSLRLFSKLKLLALRAGRSFFAGQWLVRVESGLRYPISDSLGRAVEFPRELGRGRASACKLDHLLAKLRWIRRV
jgi:hypothetical protein